MADAARLTDHQVGGGERSVQAARAVFLATIVMKKPPADPLDRLAVKRHARGPPADAQNRAVLETCNRLQIPGTFIRLFAPQSDDRLLLLLVAALVPRPAACCAAETWPAHERGPRSHR
jgi:hypothetical protein